MMIYPRKICNKYYKTDFRKDRKSRPIIMKESKKCRFQGAKPHSNKQTNKRQKRKKKLGPDREILPRIYRRVGLIIFKAVRDI